MTPQPQSAAKTEYASLAHPPPQKKSSKQTLQLESIASQINSHRSRTFSGIVAWASHVQPGSPTSLCPHSPHRRSSIRRDRCPSIMSIHATSTSFLHLTPTPTTVHATTPSIRDFKADLTAVGYTSIFLQLPNTPISATLSLSIKPPSPNAVENFPVPPIRSPSCQRRNLTHLRSLSVLRSRGRSKSVGPNSPTKMKAKNAAASATIIKRKKSKYGIRPPPLANELALMQFADGGNMDHNIKRVMKTQAKATGTVSRGDVYRDGVGGVWLDQDEELEYSHLLAENHDSRLQPPQWVTFGNNIPPFATCISEDERRGSMSTQNSGINPNRMVQPVDLLGGDDHLFGNTFAPVTHTPGSSLLAFPSRSNRPTKHLQNTNFLVDVAFSRPHALFNSYEPLNWSDANVKLKEKGRKRPAPLKLSPPSLASKWPVNSPIGDPRQDFIQSSFQPTLGPATVTPVAISDAMQLDLPTRLADSNRAIQMPPSQTRTASDDSTSFMTKTKKSVLNMKGLFRCGWK